MWYIILVITMASAFTREALVMNCVPMQDVSFSPLVVIIGITVSASSSALGALFGGARVLQALSRDKLYGGYLKPFAMGTAHGDEPRNAVFMTWAIAQACCLIGSLNVVAGFITSFFCLSYALCNLTCFVLSVSGGFGLSDWPQRCRGSERRWGRGEGRGGGQYISRKEIKIKIEIEIEIEIDPRAHLLTTTPSAAAGTPNFRPIFKFWSKWSAMLGFVLSLSLTFYIDPVVSGVSSLLLLMIFLVLLYTGASCGVQFVPSLPPLLSLSPTSHPLTLPTRSLTPPAHSPHPLTHPTPTHTHPQPRSCTGEQRAKR